MHRKLGNVASTSQRRLNSSCSSKGRLVNVVQATKFAEGEATERFTCRMQDGRLLLVGCRINSGAQIVK